MLYIDPGSGALVWQLVTAVGLGWVFQMRKSIARIFRRTPPSQTKSPVTE